MAEDTQRHVQEEEHTRSGVRAAQREHAERADVILTIAWTRTLVVPVMQDVSNHSVTRQGPAIVALPAKTRRNILVGVPTENVIRAAGHGT